VLHQGPVEKTDQTLGPPQIEKVLPGHAVVQLESGTGLALDVLGIHEELHQQSLP
jgi:hypothetical protein